MNFTGKSILLTNLSIGDYAGSEINCLSLAEALRGMGLRVEVAAFNYAFPIRAEFEKAGISVKNVFFDKLELSEYDVIWAHHAAVLDHVLFELGVSAERIIFSSLSPFEPHEAPPEYVGLLALCLANSEESLKKLSGEGVSPDMLRLFPNFVPASMLECELPALPEKPAKLAVVSNHIPDEVYTAVSLLRERGVECEFFGLGHRQELIDAELLRQYDGLITIGKTVQYGMAVGLPVFCYDKFGGCGWLSGENLSRAADRNFSGRGFGALSAEDICGQVLSGYSSAVGEREALREFVRSNCVLEDNIRALLEELFVLPETDTELIKSTFPAVARRSRRVTGLYRYNLYREMKIIELENSSAEAARIFADKLSEYADRLSEKSAQIVLLENDRLIAEEKHRDELDAVNEKLDYMSEELSRLSGVEAELARVRQENEGLSAQCSMLAQVNAEKERELDLIYRSKAWKCIMIYRRTRDFFVIRIRRIKGRLRAKRAAKEVQKPVETPKKPLVTVAIPIYDRTDVLIESIESILAQSWPNIEIIAVCDGSPEKTLEIVRRYEAEGKLRAFYYKDNSGNAVRGRNKAIREARGVYLAFQDSDDIAAPERIALSVEYMEKYSADVVYGGWRALVDGSREIDIKNGQEVFSPDCDLEMLKSVCVPCQSTVMVRTEVLRRAGGLKSEMRYREDHELWLRLAYMGCKFKAIDAVLTNLRLHGGNLELTFKDTDDKWFALMLEQYTKLVPMKPKVAYLIPGCGISGGIAVICQHLNRLRRRGFDVLMLSESGETAIDWFPGQMVDIIPISEAPDNIDILVATGWSTAYSAQSIKAGRRFYFVQSDESRFSPPGSEASRRALATYSMDYEFITEAKWIQKWLLESFGKQANYIPNGIDPDIISCTEDRSAAPREKLRVLLEGPIDIPYKGMEDAFRAVEGLDCEVWCISSAGTPKAGWHCDRFFSKVPMMNMKYIYSSCDILLKMSRVEGFFGPPMEMMACGGVCVVGKVTGYDEYIVDGYNALVVEPGDVRGAHDALERLINDPALRAQLAENGRKTASEWQWEPSIDALESIYYPEQA